MLAVYPHPRYDASVTEREFQGRILTTAQMYGWRHMHIGESTKRVRRGGKYITVADPDTAGWPDLVLCHRRRGRIVFREVKTDKGRITDNQRDWLDLLEACGMDVGVWRPRDWNDILKELST